MGEVNAHEGREHWNMIKLKELPAEQYVNVLMSTILEILSFKHKIFTDGGLLKHKARLCVNGGIWRWVINYWETYPPVENWISVRNLLAIFNIFNLKSRSIDFVLIFPQTDLDVNVYMGFQVGVGKLDGG